MTLAGLRGLQTVRSKSGAGLSWLHVHFDPATEYNDARQEVINRLQLLEHLPPGVNPHISPGLVAETLRYILVSPRDALDRPIYTLNDLRTLQEWYLERLFRRVPGVAELCTSGGTVKRYEIVPDPDRLRRYGITLKQLGDTIVQCNAHVADDGFFDGGVDPMSAEVLTAADPRKGALLLRRAEQKRLREFRGAQVVANVNQRPVLLGDLVQGGPTMPGEVEGSQGVVVGSQPRLGRIASSGPGTYQDADVVQGIVQMPKVGIRGCYAARKISSEN